jgi:hypothetical protein
MQNLFKNIKAFISVQKFKVKQIQNMIWKQDLENVFSDIYLNNRWGSKTSVSGPGSDLVHSSAIRSEIPILLKEINAKSLLDSACGDFCWMNEIKLNLDKYIGVDIVPELISQNKTKYGNEIYEFMTLNIINDNMPMVDIILCRDCLVHLSFLDAIDAIRNFKKSRSKYLLTTTFTNISKNQNINSGDWRALNMRLPPFNFPKPIKLINEKYTDGNNKYSDKCLGLWKLENIIL